MASLYARGWRQGSIFAAGLPLDAVRLDANGQLERETGRHGIWVIATQDCDLDATDDGFADPRIELRPVFTDDPPQDWGIRSARLLLTEQEYIVSSSPRVTVAATVLTKLLAEGCARREPDPARRAALKTWLGLRYDRPAVPTALVPLAMRVAKEVRRQRQPGRRVRDVLMQFDDSVQPPLYSLYAVLVDPADEADVRAWLATAAQAVPVELGVADIIEAGTAAQISLNLVETSYSADVSQLTWRPNQPHPEGAL